MICNSCLETIKTHDNFVAEPTGETDIKRAAKIQLIGKELKMTGKGFFRTYHWGCIKKVPHLRVLQKQNYSL